LTWFAEKYHLRELPRINIVSGFLGTPKGEPSLGVFADKTDTLFRLSDSEELGTENRDCSDILVIHLLS